MAGVVKGMDSAMQSMNLEKVCNHNSIYFYYSFALFDANYSINLQ